LKNKGLYFKKLYDDTNLYIDSGTGGEVELKRKNYRTSKTLIFAII